MRALVRLGVWGNDGDTCSRWRGRVFSERAGPRARRGAQAAPHGPWRPTGGCSCRWWSCHRRRARTWEVLIRRLTESLDGPLGGQYRIWSSTTTAPNRDLGDRPRLADRDTPGSASCAGRRARPLHRGDPGLAGRAGRGARGHRRRPPAPAGDPLLALWQRDRGRRRSRRREPPRRGRRRQRLERAPARPLPRRPAPRPGLLPGVVSRVKDPMSGYFMVRREAIAGRTMNPLGYKILIEVLGRGTSQGRRGRLRIPGAQRGREQGHVATLYPVHAPPRAAARRRPSVGRFRASAHGRL